MNDRKSCRLFSRAAIIGSLVAVSVPAAACSVSSDYRVPNTLELIKRADAIVVAEVIGAEVGDGDHDPQVVFRLEFRTPLGVGKSTVPEPAGRMR